MTLLSLGSRWVMRIGRCGWRCAAKIAHGIGLCWSGLTDLHRERGRYPPEWLYDWAEVPNRAASGACPILASYAEGTPRTIGDVTGVGCLIERGDDRR
jgi:hypothetical protein